MTPVVEHLLNGIRVQCADGTVIVCPPLMLDKGMDLSDTWDERIGLSPKIKELRAVLEAANGAMPAAEREKIEQDLFETVAKAGALRYSLVRKFLAVYPDLAAHISAGDVESLIPHFFWSLTGADVMGQPESNAPTSPPIGTASGENTSLPGDPSPTPA